MLRQLLDIARRGRTRRPRSPLVGGVESAPSASPITTTAPAPEPATFDLPFMIRPADAADLPALAAIFRHSILELAARDYDAAQLAAWSGRADAADFQSGLATGVTILAENHGEPVAFAQLDPLDHVRMLYVRPDWAGLGIATLLCQYLEDEARIAGSRELTTAASRTARRFFESMGYRAEREETVQLGDVALDRTLMRKPLGA